jgi:hypothetical protein
MFAEAMTLSCRLFVALNVVALVTSLARYAAGMPSGLPIATVEFTVWPLAGTLLSNCEDHSK